MIIIFGILIVLAQIFIIKESRPDPDSYRIRTGFFDYGIYSLALGAAF